MIIMVKGRSFFFTNSSEDLELAASLEDSIDHGSK
jgi:hypothetical protein